MCKRSAENRCLSRTEILKESARMNQKDERKQVNIAMFVRTMLFRYK